MSYGGSQSHMTWCRTTEETEEKVSFVLRENRLAALAERDPIASCPCLCSEANPSFAALCHCESLSLIFFHTLFGRLIRAAALYVLV